MIITNKSTEVGDTLVILGVTPIIGLVALYSFIDDTDGEYADRLFKKTFRYSVDGLNYSQWLPLTNDNVAGVQVQSNDTFYVEYNYERIGADITGELAFNSVTLNGEYITTSDPDVYIDSIFSNFFPLNNVCSIGWSVNVLEKLYKKGIIPAYVERDKTGDNTSDRDYIDFWRAITHYFALYVCLARQFQFFYQNRALLLEYIKQRGLFVCDDIDFVDLMFLMQNFYDQIRQRGTRQVFKPKVDGTVNGEYLRMICYNTKDEFIANLNKNSHIGWNVNNSSPLYRGLEDRLNVNKYYIDDFADSGVEISDLSVDDTYLPYVDIISSSFEMQPAPFPVGIGNGDKRIIINPNIDYEITFVIISQTSVDQTFSFGVNSYDKNGNVKALLDIQTLLGGGANIDKNEFITSASLNIADEPYFVRGIIYNKNNYVIYNSVKTYQQGAIVYYSGDLYKAKRKVPPVGTDIELGTILPTPGTVSILSPILWDFWEVVQAGDYAQAGLTNLNIGDNLKFSEDVVMIDPYILFDNINDSPNNLSVYNIRVQPISTPYEKGFVQMANMLELWGTNNNKNLSENKINKDTSHFLIPYDTVLKNNFYPTEINKE